MPTKDTWGVGMTWMPDGVLSPKTFGHGAASSAVPLPATPMATLPGLPQTDEPEPDALPVEPDDGTTLPGSPPEPGHVPVDPPRA